jgi:hypothetical protein
MCFTQLTLANLMTLLLVVKWEDAEDEEDYRVEFINVLATTEKVLTHNLQIRSF